MLQKLPLLGGGFRLPVALGIIVLLGMGGSFYLKQQTEKEEAAKQQVAVVEVKTVTALGKLEPQGEIIKLSAPTSGEGSKIEKLLVREGESIKAGQLIAILDNQGRLQAAVNEAKEKVRVAQANLAKVKAGAKQGEIDAQKATIAQLEAEQSTEIEAQKATVARLVTEKDTQIEAQLAAIASGQAELANAQAEYKRYEALYQEGAISASTQESKRLTLQTAQQKVNQTKANLKRIQGSAKQQIAEAQANLRKIETSREQQVKESQFTLRKIAEVRPVDVIAAEAEVNSARASLKRAEENLAQAYVKSPQDGQVYETYARPGEVVGSDGIVDIGRTSQMYGVVEVYHSDINKVRVGQKVQITSNSLPSELQGIVERIGIQVKRQNVINADPTSNIDDRVIEVHVRLDKASSEKAAKFTNLQIQAVVEL
jgi:HlyD family secretion protein